MGFLLKPLRSPISNQNRLTKRSIVNLLLVTTDAGNGSLLRHSGPTHVRHTGVGCTEASDHPIDENPAAGHASFVLGHYSLIDEVAHFGVSIASQ